MTATPTLTATALDLDTLATVTGRVAIFATPDGKLDTGAPRPLAAPKSKTAKAKPGRRLADSMPSISKQKKKGFKKGSRSEPVMLGTPRKRADLTVEEAMLGTTEERTERAIDEADAKARAILWRAILWRAILWRATLGAIL